MVSSRVWFHRATSAKLTSAYFQKTHRMGQWFPFMSMIDTEKSIYVVIHVGNTELEFSNFPTSFSILSLTFQRSIAQKGVLIYSVSRVWYSSLYIERFTCK